jgi:hypothetical protein
MHGDKTKRDGEEAAYRSSGTQNLRKSTETIDFGIKKLLKR